MVGQNELELRLPSVATSLLRGANKSVSFEISELLVGCASGDRDSHDRLVAQIYEELRAHSSRAKRGFGRSEMETTDLLHESYVRLLNRDGNLAFENRRHLFGAFLVATQRVLTDQARQRNAQKRGGSYHRINLDKILVISLDDAMVVEVADMLDALEKQDEFAATVARGRLFRYSIAEIAELTGTSVKVVESKWYVARALMRVMYEPV